MNQPSIQVQEQVVLDRSGLQELFDVLRGKGYQIVGPTLREGAIIYDELTSIADLPEGWTDEQDGGTYRLKKRNDKALFGYVVGPHSWKKYLHPPILRLLEAKRTNDGFEVIPEEEPKFKYAFIGARSCELHAIAVQDKVFLTSVGGRSQGDLSPTPLSQYTDPHYKARRENVFIVAVNCGQAGGTCFCVSMKTGPKSTFGFDLALTELLDSTGHEFLVEIGTELGAEVINRIEHRKAVKEEQERAETIVEKTAQEMGRQMDTTEIKSLLYRNLDHPGWEAVANRCLTCGNCTMVCPTCFCTTVEDTTDLTGDHAERWRKWDSCFTTDFSYIHGGNVRTSSKSRYRQWMTHKLATWIDQFGTSGCVGCGRCITWCPVGIDITEEVAAIRKTEEREVS